MMPAKTTDDSSQQEKIFNLDGQPFESFEQAAQMRDLLVSQSGFYYRVELLDAKGESKSSSFIVLKTETDCEYSDETGRQTKDTEQIAKDNLPSQMLKQSSSASEAVNKTYHPALRTYILRIPLAIIGFFLVFFALEIWVLIISALGLKGLPTAIDPNLLVNVTKIAGSAWILWLLFGILLNFYGTKLTIDQRDISFNQGLFSRDQTHVRFSEIRTIGLRQGILDRLLNIGILEFASSGTDDVDIRFINMPSPAKVKADIERLIEQYS